jgi:acetylornithine/succinyldiaminopimelate/putrescine aminotransferase
MLGLEKLEQVLRIPTNHADGNLLRAQTTAAGIAVNAQLRADETRLRVKVQGDVLQRLLKAIEREKAQIKKLERKGDMIGRVVEVAGEVVAKSSE